MNEDSAPGKYGGPIEVYRSFSSLLKEDFADLVNYDFFEKTKTTSEKTNKAKWRPISFL